MRGVQTIHPRLVRACLPVLRSVVTSASAHPHPTLRLPGAPTQRGSDTSCSCATEQHSGRGTKRTEREEQGGASKRSKRTTMNDAPLGAHPPPGAGGGGGGGAGGAVAAEATTKADSAVT
jgi:hypothetical protein